MNHEANSVLDEVQPQKTSNIALAIFSFNRPHYLKFVLRALEDNAALEGVDLYFFQDGAVNKFSGRVAADEGTINQCLALWTAAKLPNKHSLQSAINKGIAISQFDAKVLLFENMQYDEVMFFEDDLVPNRNYIRTLRTMLQQFRNERHVGAVMCHGGRPKIYSDNEKRSLLPRVYFDDSNLWGWATWNSRWQKIKPAFLGYYALICDIDYRLKSKRRSQILSLYDAIGFKNRITSQDAAIQYAMIKNDLIFLQTVIHRGRYIGAKGEHMKPNLYRAAGYSAIALPDDSQDGKVERFEGYEEDSFLRGSKSLFLSPRAE